MNLVVTEIFLSLQGEGPLIGLPSVFVRLGGFIEPLCPWCDTSYAWHEFSEMQGDEILHRIERYRCRDIVITGGEPFLQWETGLEDLHRELVKRRYRILYETSGKAGIPDLANATVVLSPKHIEGRWHVSGKTVGKADYLKFIADDRASLDEIGRFITDNATPAEKVFVMPMGSTREEQLARMASVFAFCRDSGFRMTPRLHILIFDDQRGV